MDIKFVIAKDKDGKYVVFENIMLQDSHDKINETLKQDDPAVAVMDNLWSVGDYLQEIYRAEQEPKLSFIPQELKHYVYATNHGVGIGSLPKDVKVLDYTMLAGGKMIISLDRPLTTQELKTYGIWDESRTSEFLRYLEQRKA